MTGGEREGRTGASLDRAEPSGRTPRKPSRWLLPSAVAVAVVAADQLSKDWALHHVREPRHLVGSIWLILTENTGAAFGLGKGVTPLVEACVVVLVLAIVFFGRRATRRASKPELATVGLLLGGAISNLADRLLRHDHGAVIDFIDIARVGSRDYWPIFDLADAAIVLGAVGLLVVYALRSRRKGATGAGPAGPARGGGSTA